jgi:hypothetical protein
MLVLDFVFTKTGNFHSEKERQHEGKKQYGANAILRLSTE